MNSEGIVGVACSYLGLKEKPGAKHEPVIVAMLQGVGRWWRKDETPWCSAFANRVMETMGFDTSGITAAAITWETWGEPVARHEVRPGDLMITRRSKNAKSKSRHVVIVMATKYVGRNRFVVIGGNQNDTVSTKRVRPPADAVFRRAVAGRDRGG